MKDRLDLLHFHHLHLTDPHHQYVCRSVSFLFSVAFVSENHHMQLPLSSSNQLVVLCTCENEVMKCMNRFPSSPCMLLVATPNKHRSLTDNGLLHFKSLCQRIFTLCAIVRIQMGARTDLNSGIFFTSYEHKVSQGPCLALLEVVSYSLQWTVTAPKQVSAPVLGWCRTSVAECSRCSDAAFQPRHA